MDEFNRTGAPGEQLRQLARRLTPSDDWAKATPAPLFDFRSVWRLLRRRWKLITCFTLFCLAVVYALSEYTPNQYRAKSRILLEEQSINPFGRDEIFADLKLSNPVVESQMQLMRSPYLLSQVVDNLDLDQNEEFLSPPPTPLQSKLDELIASLGLAGETPPPKSEAQLFQDAVDRLRDNLSVSRNALTLVVSINYTSHSQEMSARIVNAVAEAYLNNRLEIRQDSAGEAASWFDERIAELNVRLNQNETRIEQLRSGGSGALEASQSGSALIEARTELRAAMASRSRAQTLAARLRALLSSERGLSGVTSDFGSEELAQVVAQASQSRSDLSRARSTLPGDAPEITALATRLDELEAEGRAILQVMLDEAEVAAAEATAGEAEAQANFDAARNIGGQSTAGALEQEVRALESEARIFRQLHDTYLESYLRTIQEQSFPSTEATIIEFAQPPEFPDGPGLKRLAILGLLIGLTLGTGGAFLAEAADGRVRSLSHLVRATSAPVLGALPTPEQERTSIAPSRNAEPLRIPNTMLPSRKQNSDQETFMLPENRLSLVLSAPQLYAAIDNPLSDYSETIRRVKVEVDNVRALFDPDNEQHNIVGFISDQANKGRSIAATNYAEMLAVGGSRTLLIDLDWKGLFLTEKTTPATSYGLVDLVLPSGETPLEQALWYDERTGLYFLPNRTLNKDLALDPAVFDQSALKALIKILAVKFDNVVLDLSPMAVSSDVAALASTVSGYVAVAEWGKTKSASLKSELARAAIRPPKLIGALLNGVSIGQLDRYDHAA